jgi:hypothetical protein
MPILLSVLFDCYDIRQYELPNEMTIKDIKQFIYDRINQDEICEILGSDEDDILLLLNKKIYVYFYDSSKTCINSKYCDSVR